MNYNRQLIQYNDLVFDGLGVIQVEAYTASYKSFDEAYSFAHGSYSPYKGDSVLAEAISIPATIRIDLTRMPCDVRQFYKPFLTTQLAKYGKLWSIENNTIEWAYAQVNGKTQNMADDDQLSYTVEFFLPEGIWHKANQQKAFLVPHDPCTFMDCYDYKEIKPCLTGDCCHCGSEPKKYCHCCECHDLSKDMALCYLSKDDLQRFYSCDGAGYRIVYSCEAGEKYFGGYYGADHLGQKFCAECGVIAGQLYSDTEIPTKNVKITLHGKFTNPYIEINGNGNIVKGEYDGTLIIYPDKSVYFDNGCGQCDPLDIGLLYAPLDNSFGWTIYPRNNQLIVEGACCGTACVYVEVDAITS